MNRERRRVGLAAALVLTLLAALSAGGQPNVEREPSPLGGAAVKEGMGTRTSTPSEDTRSSSVAGARRHNVLPRSSSLSLDSEMQRELKKLDAKRAEIDRAMAALRVAEERVKARIAELKMVCKAPDQEEDKAHQEKVKHLAKIVQRMQPQESARFIVGLEEDVAASILEEMPAAKAAPVMAAMSADKAAALGKRYLRGSNPPRPGPHPGAAKP